MFSQSLANYSNERILRKEPEIITPEPHVIFESFSLPISGNELNKLNDDKMVEKIERAEQNQEHQPISTNETYLSAESTNHTNSTESSIDTQEMQPFENSDQTPFRNDSSQMNQTKNNAQITAEVKVAKERWKPMPELEEKLLKADYKKNVSWWDISK